MALRIYTRHEFGRWLNLRDRRLGGRNCVAWSCEPKNHPSQWFVCVAPVCDRTKGKNYTGTPADYWTWCREKLQGRVLGYYSDRDNGIEWWGFTNQDDILLWTLKWA